jgi:alkanesulfonate monooxygenase SsuD/methylene tetrahydromethanopterin reductase-like flavin-dependent oxidoreductase (luciferase family)
MGRRVTDKFIPLATQFVHNPEAVPTKSTQSQGLLGALRRLASAPGAAPPGIAIGNPDRIIRELKTWQSMGVDHVNFILNVLEVIPQEQVLASLRLFAREVMPHFQDRNEVAAAGGE